MLTNQTQRVARGRICDRPIEPSGASATTERLTVMHVFPTFAMGGSQARFVSLANRCGSRYRHIIISLDGDQAAAAQLSSDLRIHLPPVHAPKKAMLANAARFHLLLRQWRPDVLVTCNWGAIEFALGNLWPVTRHIHVEDGFGPEERRTQIRRRGLVRRLALRRSTVVLPSRTLERIAVTDWGLRRVLYLPNGVDLNRFRPGPPRAGSEVTIGTVAALREEKNVARLLAAFALIAADRNVRLVIVGDGPQRANLQAEATARNIAERVTFTGQRGDTPALYQGFDIFALSSDTEQMPLSVLEAMATGLPVAATAVGDVRSMLAAENRPLVSACDHQALARSLRTLVDDADLRRSLGAANRTKAEASFDEALMVRRWQDLWDGTAKPT